MPHSKYIAQKVRFVLNGANESTGNMKIGLFCCHFNVILLKCNILLHFFDQFFLSWNIDLGVTCFIHTFKLLIYCLEIEHTHRRTHEIVSKVKTSWSVTQLIIHKKKNKTICWTGALIGTKEPQFVRFRHWFVKIEFAKIEIFNRIQNWYNASVWLMKVSQKNKKNSWIVPNIWHGIRRCASLDANPICI